VVNFGSNTQLSLQNKFYFDWITARLAATYLLEEYYVITQHRTFPQDSSFHSVPPCHVSERSPT